MPTDPCWRTIPGRRVVLHLGRYRTHGPIRLGAIDVISGGAITNAALYALLRMPAVTAAMRIIEPDLLDLPNLNRYALARRSMTGWPKTRALEAFQTPAIIITGHEDFFNGTTAACLAPIAPRLLVGVDHIPSRWDAQRAADPGWVCACSSSHDFVLVSAHPAGSACTDCVHPRDENIAGDIPDDLLRVILGRPDPGAGTGRQRHRTSADLDQVHPRLAARRGQPARHQPVPPGRLRKVPRRPPRLSSPPAGHRHRGARRHIAVGPGPYTAAWPE